MKILSVAKVAFIRQVLYIMYMSHFLVSLADVGRVFSEVFLVSNAASEIQQVVNQTGALLEWPKNKSAGQCSGEAGNTVTN
jgi:hypothetical protein